MIRRSTQTLIKVEIATIVILLLAVLARGQASGSEGHPPRAAASEAP